MKQVITINTKTFTEKNHAALDKMIANDEIDLLEDLLNGKMRVMIDAETLFFMRLANIRGTMNWDIEF